MTAAAAFYDEASGQVRPHYRECSRLHTSTDGQRRLAFERARLAASGGEYSDNYRANERANEVGHVE